MSEQQQPSFNIEKIFVKDLSLEVPNAPQIFLDNQMPEIQIQLQTRAADIGDGYYESVLTVTVTAKHEEKTYFLVEAGQAGIFQIRNIPAQDMDPLLGIACPNILFPYVRETISDAVGRAGFPPVLLAPVNFEAMYQQRMMAEAQQKEQGPHEVPIQ
ncbi:protein-export chaperone SecB [Denitratisoma oestradiolicum]|uniref:Protein-export protein SecB n=1 Tax=Denitratisoma oestradiolicum TaxID=311182 RepID=A0A6S6XSA6_9PROT|nr:protein-export chaperone SecB [Denitratisoma oestradiolicum]TWO80520.1 protein-export chaperone SecB [Denitratisoma oestradiolicum]CAB1367590.1 protein export chaperone [Denitratisoma oestradiolicum]